MSKRCPACDGPLTATPKMHEDSPTEYYPHDDRDCQLTALLWIARSMQAISESLERLEDRL